MKNLLFVLFLTFALLSVVDMRRKGRKDRVQRVAFADIQGTVHGNVTFTQEGCHGPVHIEGTLSGLSKGSYGFHVHEKGDVTDGDCMKTGSHFNPGKRNHGAPKDRERHVGDLGNIEFDDQNVAKIDFYDSVITLTDENGIAGRGLVIHDAMDDLGKGGSPDSLKTGNAGKRAGCGVIIMKTI